MKFAFFGTPEFAAIILQKLIDAELPPALVVCNPDRPVGRKKIVVPPLTKLIASESHIPFWQPEKLILEEAKAKLAPMDLAIVAAYSKIIPKEILALPRLGFLGVHPSLLPKYRGASPIQSVILNNEPQTGVTLYLMDEKVDHGPILAQQALYENIEKIDYAGLLQKLATLGAEMLVQFLPEFVKGEVKPQIQNEDKATLTKKFSTEDAYINLEKDEPTLTEKKVRALNPEPGVWTIQNGKRMKILEAELVEGKLKLKKIQIEGKTPQSL